ncbi:MAG: hypothetical protein ACOY94_20115 [Bacillota bacterium]
MITFRPGFRYWLTSLPKQIAADRQASREHLVAEVGLLRAALDQVRGEIYTDPETGLRLVSFARTGKWFVLDRAITLRNYLLPDRPRQHPAAARHGSRLAASTRYFPHLVEGPPT